jgi:hypothetical protein
LATLFAHHGLCAVGLFPALAATTFRVPGLHRIWSIVFLYRRCLGQLVVWRQPWVSGYGTDLCGLALPLGRIRGMDAAAAVITTLIWRSFFSWHLAQPLLDPPSAPGWPICEQADHYKRYNHSQKRQFRRAFFV